MDSHNVYYSQTSHDIVFEQIARLYAHNCPLCAAGSGSGGRSILETTRARNFYYFVIFMSQYFHVTKEMTK